METSGLWLLQGRRKHPHFLSLLGQQGCGQPQSQVITHTVSAVAGQAQLHESVPKGTWPISLGKQGAVGIPRAAQPGSVGRRGLPGL